MAKILVVYYSRTGHTEQVAKALAEAIGADLETISEPRKRHGFWQYWKSGRESLLGILPEIDPSDHDPGDYDFVVLGSPVWASRPSTPLRAWLAAHKNKLGKIACFVTLGGAGAEKTLQRIAETAGSPALATYSATEGQLNSGQWKEGLERFATAIASAAG